MSTETRFRLGISHGDVNGISYEVILKALADPRLLELITPIVYGSAKVASYHRKTIKGIDVSFNPIRHPGEAGSKGINIINITDDEIRIELGKATEVSGEMAVRALDSAVNDLLSGQLDALLTAPIDKHSVQSESFQFHGHTEYLAEKTKTKDYLMLMISPELRIGMASGHLPLQEVSSFLNEEIIFSRLRVMHRCLVEDFGISRPRIAVLGLNPHSGDGGLLGKEEDRIIKPAIEKAQQEGQLIFGPFPADGFFGSLAYRKFDAVLAMYHDQGLIPFKMLAFHNGVNYTAGLPVIRTSPAHGTAFDLAGKDRASPDSLREAIYLALDVHRNRSSLKALRDNAMPQPGQGDKKPKP